MYLLNLADHNAVCGHHQDVSKGRYKGFFDYSKTVYDSLRDSKGVSLR